MKDLAGGRGWMSTCKFSKSKVVNEETYLRCRDPADYHLPPAGQSTIPLTTNS